MQQTCVDDVLMSNYSQINDTETLTSVIVTRVSDVVSYKCEPFDCSGHGRCVNGSCVCDTGRESTYTRSWLLTARQLC